MISKSLITVLLAVWIISVSSRPLLLDAAVGLLGGATSDVTNYSKDILSGVPGVPGVSDIHDGGSHGDNYAKKVLPAVPGVHNVGGDSLPGVPGLPGIPGVTGVPGLPNTGSLLPPTVAKPDTDLIPNAGAPAQESGVQDWAKSNSGPTPAVDTAISNSGPTPAPDAAFKYSVGYVTSWSADRPCMAVHPTDIDASAYTHLMFSFAIIDATYKLAINKTDESDFLRGLVGHVNGKYPGVKVVVVVGGWNFNDPGPTQSRFTEMVATPATRKTFIDSTVSLLKDYGANGIDLDWLHPTSADRGGRQGDADNYVALAREMRAAMPMEYSISMAIPVGWSSYYAGYNVAAMAPFLDFIGCMTYDLHGVWDYTAADGGKLASHTDMRDVIRGIDTVVSSGVPKEKLLLSLAFYGRSFKQADPAKTNIGDPFVDPAVGRADPGRCTGESGFLGYNEISEMINQKAAIRRNTFDNATVSNILAYGQDQWLTYDDGYTFSQRINYVKTSGLGGMTVWSVDLDDDKRQLSNAIKNLRTGGGKSIGGTTGKTGTVPESGTGNAGGDSTVGGQGKPPVGEIPGKDEKYKSRLLI